MMGARKGIVSAAAVLMCAVMAVAPRAQTLVISEIHYHPLAAWVPPGGTILVDGDEFEFLEVRNDGDTPLNLNGYSITGGITFVFSGSHVLSPGASMVIVENANFFAHRYPWATSVAGAYSGKLSNDGETLTLKNASGVTVFEVTYNDANGWPEAADGQGRSLILIQPEGDPQNPAHWAASAELHGAPTAADTAHVPDIVINEVLAHSDPPLVDVIELHNRSDSSMDLTGWYLSDDWTQPKKYRISGMVIGAGGYAVLSEHEFNANPPLLPDNVPFALSSLGDELILTAPLPDDRLRLADAVEFGATETDISIGRFPNGTGDFATLASRTFGTTNSAPRSPPIVINEIMYHPRQEDEEGFEFIELWNASGQHYDLSGWLLDGVNFLFPPGTTLAPGAFLVVCADQDAVADAYGISNVLGNWPGQLQNGGERIELLTSEGVVVDRVRYDDQEPWPAVADGYGPSLERIRSADDGDTYLNWRASRNPLEWTQLVVTQSVASGTAQLTFWLDFEGKCHLDDISVKPVGGGGEAVLNGDFELGGLHWSAVGNHATSRTEEEGGYSGTTGMVMVGNFTRTLPDEGGVVINFGQEEGHRLESEPFPLAGGDYELSFRVRPSGPSQSLFYSLGGVVHEHQLGSYGTPGKANSAASGLPLMGIAEAVADLAVAPIGVPNTIRARVEGDFQDAEVTAYYRIMDPDTYQFTDVHYNSAPMADDGVSPDLVADDGEYAVTVPGVAAPRSIVRYHVNAVSTSGAQARSPTVDNPAADRAYWVQGNSVQTTLPNWHVISDGSPIVYPNSYRCCAVSPEGEVFTDLRIRYRGRPGQSGPDRSGLALLMNRSQPYAAFFGASQNGINFRHRKNNSLYWYSRVVHEVLGYRLQRMIGLVTPHLRHICLWLNGEPTITTELEDPEEGFLALQNQASGDYISRAGYIGRGMIDGDPALDNFDAMLYALEHTTGAARAECIRTNLWVDSVRYSMALMSIMSSFDQNIEWNMFQHRRAQDGRWTQYPWDVDKVFLAEANGQNLIVLHPYYMTPDYPSVWNTLISEPLGTILFHPASSIHTLPYRYRQQMTLWRYCHTIFTPDCLYPILDQIQADVEPAYAQIGYPTTLLQAAVADVKSFIVNRRDFLMNGDWPDKMAEIWSVPDYTPGALVINEIMYDPDVGGEYIGLYNSGSTTLDLSWWRLSVGAENYWLPHGTTLAPGSELVVADTFQVLTNAYPELNHPAAIVPRYPGTPIWDEPMDFYTAAEHRTRVVDIPNLTLPNFGATIEVHDLCGQVIDSVTYSSAAPWPAPSGAALELVDAAYDNALPASWRVSFIGGTPSTSNTAAQDVDNDGLIDSWESQINTDILQVGPEGDEDDDGIPNQREFTLGMNPMVKDAVLARLWIEQVNSEIQVNFNTVAVSGTGYDLFGLRRYTLEDATALQPPTWAAVAGFADLPGDGFPIQYAHPMPAGSMFYRYKVQLERKTLP
ncbi:MAG: lamin tail domain-containing protein [Kiritimatiellae bacterium]|nr:lamin tail domain-containing protein [Kiritimatiellia bacterium]